MHSNDIYRLIKYYNRYSEKIKESINLRGIDFDCNKIDVLISNLKKLNSEFNYVCRIRNEGIKNYRSVEEREQYIRKQKRDLGKKISTEEILLKEAILSLPNILINNDKEDSIVFVKNNDIDNLFGIKFSEYIRTKCHIYNAGNDVFYNDELSKLYFNLKNFLIQKNSNKFKLVHVPSIVTRIDLEASGHLPKFENNIFLINRKKEDIKNENDEFLIPTSEVTMCKLLSYLNTQEEHLLYTYTPCFRNESSHPSKINTHLIRQSMFTKIELFFFCKIENTQKYVDICLQQVTNIMEQFGFTYRLIKIGVNNISNTAALQYDFEVWFPKSEMWVEISSCSNCLDYQLWRKTNFTINNGINYSNDYENYATGNCSCLPLQRIIAAIIEYYYCPINDKIIIDFNNLN